MLDIDYYAKKHIGVNSTLWLKYFGKNKYKNVNTLIYNLQNLDVNWIKDEVTKRELIAICSTFELSLKDEQLKFEDIIEIISIKDIEIANYSDFLDLEFNAGFYTKGKCPSCSKKELYIPKQGKALSLVCNRKNACGYSSSAYNYLKQYKQKSAKDALEILANIADTSLEEINYANEKHIDTNISFSSKKVIMKKVEKLNVPTVINYITFNSEKEYKNIDFKEYLVDYSRMSEVQQFKMIATAIFDYSCGTEQRGKQNYFDSIGISFKKNPILKEKINMINSNIGFLYKTDILPLIEDLKKYFSTDDLVKYGVIHGELKDDGSKNSFAGKFKQDVQEGLVVIPNYDMYTNMISGLKFRKTKLRTWINKETKKIEKDSNKEPEFSYKRIAKPLPYHLTRVSLLDKSYRFRFFEGQKDLHSMPSKVKYCDVAIPGVNGISEEMLGLFKGRIVELYFDQDKAGQEGAIKIKVLLEKAGAIVINKTWDISLGKDINDVLQNKNIFKII